MAVGEDPLFGGVESDGERAAAPEDGEDDIIDVHAVAEAALAVRSIDDGVDQRGCSCSSVGPVDVFDHGVDDVQRAETVVDGEVHVGPESISAAHGFVERSRARGERSVEHVQRHRPEQGLLVRKVAVEGADPDAGSTRDRIAGGLTADLEHQFQGSVEQPFAVPPGISAHRLGAPSNRFEIGGSGV